MFEAKYSRYITKNSTRFATPTEIKDECIPVKKGEKPMGCGAALLYHDGVLHVDDSDAHYYIQGQTGSKKTRVVETSIINSILAKGENAVVNDPKGEAFRRTANAARANGYNTLVLNFRDVSKSNGWNPLSLPFRFYTDGNMPEAEQSINDFTQAVMGPASQGTNDKFWPDNAEMGLTFCTELLMDSVPIECFHMSNVIQLTHERHAPILREMLAKMDQSTSAAVCMHAILDLTAEKTTSCIYSTLKQALKPFMQNKSLLDLLCRNDIKYEDLVKKKTIIYLIYPDEKNSLGFLISLFFTQCYQYLVSYSARFHDARLPIRVNFVLEEFSNLPPVQDYENRISEARGHNIRYFLFSQSFGQLKTKYKDNADTIVANCEWIIFPSKDYAFLKMVSDFCGKEYDYYGTEHDLISVCEMQHLKKYRDGAEVLILKSGQYPFVTKLPDFEYLDVFEQYPEATLDEVKSNFTPVFLEFEDWVNGIGTLYREPFPKKRHKPKPSAPDADESDGFEEAKKALEKKLEELFGPTEEDD